MTTSAAHSDTYVIRILGLLDRHWSKKLGVP